MEATIERIESTDVVPYEVIENEAEWRTHIVNPPMNRHLPGWSPAWGGQDVVDTARLLRLEIIALCGFRFIPLQDPERFDACGACMEIAGILMNENGE